MTSSDRPPLPSFTIIVPVRPGATPAALPAIEQIRYPKERIEVLVTEGTNPSRQRNEAIKQARGDILYFLDDDSEPEPMALRRILECLLDHPDAPRIMGVGGPIVTRPGSTLFQRAAGTAMASVFGSGPTRHRHTPTGRVRPSGELELISANLAVRRAAFDVAPGFDERIFCNEENEWMNRLRRGGAVLYYHPALVALTSRRRNLLHVVTQHFRYGRGRLTHYVVLRRFANLLFLAPLVLLLATAYALLVNPWPAVLPLLAYAFLASCASLFIAVQGPRKGAMAVSLMAIFPAMHLAYGFGMVAGAARFLLWSLAGSPRRSPEVAVRVLRPLPSSP